MTATTRQPGTFSDSSGHVWSVPMTYGTARRIKQQTGIDPLKLTDPGSEEFAKVSQDSFLLMECLAAALEKELQAAGMDIDSLADRMTNEQHAQDAGVAFFEAIINFSQPGKAEILQETFSRTLRISEQSRDQRLEKIRKALNSGEMDKELQAAIEAKTPTPGG